MADRVIEGRIRQKEAVKILSLSTRQVRRIVKKVKIHSAVGVVHATGARNRRENFL